MRKTVGRVRECSLRPADTAAGRRNWSGCGAAQGAWVAWTRTAQGRDSTLTGVAHGSPCVPRRVAAGHSRPTLADSMDRVTGQKGRHRTRPMLDRTSLCDAALATLEKLNRGVLLLDAEGVVQFMNRAARVMISRGHGLSLRKRRLTFASALGAGGVRGLPRGQAGKPLAARERAESRASSLQRAGESARVAGRGRRLLRVHSRAARPAATGAGARCCATSMDSRPPRRGSSTRCTWGSRCSWRRARVASRTTRRRRC